jgi:hypothetical protein
MRAGALVKNGANLEPPRWCGCITHFITTSKSSSNLVSYLGDLPRLTTFIKVQYTYIIKLIPIHTVTCTTSKIMLKSVTKGHISKST